MSKPNKAVSTQKIDDVNVAAMLCSLGFEQSHTAMQVKRNNGRVQFVYFFNAKSTCGRYKLNECLEAWTCETFMEKYPLHELTVMRIFNENRNQMLSEIKAGQGMLTSMTVDGVDALVNLAAPKAELQKLFS
jgi:hypothetical protein